MAGLLSGLWKGLFGSRQDELNEKATEESIFQMQHPFARTMEDAQKYGINPITALGSQPSQATFSGSSSDSNAGQLLNMIPAIVQGSVSRSNTKDTNANSKEIASENNQTTKDVAHDNNTTSKDVAKLNADSNKYVADKNAEAAADLRSAQAAQAKVQTQLLLGEKEHREKYGYEPNAPQAVNALSVMATTNERMANEVADDFVPFLPSDSFMNGPNSYDDYVNWCKRLKNNGKHGKIMSKEDYYSFMETYSRTHTR